MKNTNDNNDIDSRPDDVVSNEPDVEFEPIKGTDAPANDADTLDDSVIVEENALETVKTLKEKLKKSQAEPKNISMVGRELRLTSSMLASVMKRIGNSL